MAVVGFLSLQDFIDELEEVLQPGQPVRVQHYYRTTPDKKLPLNYVEFFAEAAFSVNGDTLVCRFRTAHIAVMGQDEEGRMERFAARNERAANLLRSALLNVGYIVRRGLVATAAESKTEADPTGLWRREDLDEPSQGEES